MKITKLGHCCLLIEEQGIRILTDPGTYSTAQNEVKNIDFVLITHEHRDHLHVESLEIVLRNNPSAKVITNKSVGTIIGAKNIAYTVVSQGMKSELNGISLEGIGEKHAFIYSSIPDIENTGYFIANKLFYPGDAFTNPMRPVDVLALPVAGPWMKISEAIDYAKAVKPAKAFPVHDGMLHKDKLGPVHVLPEKELAKEGITFIPLIEGQSIEV